MLLDVLFRVQSDPMEHLGCRSLMRLEAFETGYSFCHLHSPPNTRRFRVEALLRKRLIDAYQLTNVETKSAICILLQVSPNDEAAFDLFYKHVKAVLAEHPEIMENPVLVEAHPEPSPPVSVLLDVLTACPRMYLRKLSPGMLRALLDGARLGCLDQGQTERADLDGFSKWVRNKLHNWTGIQRWENAIFSNVKSPEGAAFEWAVQEMKEYRKSKGPLSDWHFRIRHGWNVTHLELMRREGEGQKSADGKVA
jgi:hypothetical protein